jgi:hypothetical protein
MATGGARLAQRYGWKHQKLRAGWARVVRSGRAVCVRCGRPILPGSKWDLGHVDGGGHDEYAGPEHRRCNRATAGRRARPSRVW